MARKISIAGIGLLVVVVGLLLAGQWILHQREQQSCSICQRHISPQAGIVAEIGGRRRHICCAHCAVTEGMQENKPVRLIEVTDYNTRRKLDPVHAWYVDGSRVVACTHDMAHMNEMKQMDHASFDRCSPGTFAFATRGEAEGFAKQNGGAVLSLGEMLAAVNGGKVQP